MFGQYLHEELGVASCLWVDANWRVDIFVDIQLWILVEGYLIGRFLANVIFRQQVLYVDDIVDTTMWPRLDDTTTVGVAGHHE